MTAYLRKVAALAAKDLRTDLRARHTMAIVMPFAVMLLVTSGLVFGPGRAMLIQVLPGIIWLGALFAAVLASERSFENECADGALLGLILAPVPRGAIFTGKAIALTAQLIVLEAGMMLLGVMLFDLPAMARPLELTVVMFTGAAGLGALGVLFGAFASATRTRSGVFPLLALVLAAPMLLGATRGTAAALGGEDPGDWLSLLAAFDLIAWSLGALLFESVLED
ncbi:MULTISPECIES: heme exporter protein CcmB [unclassified Nonomuraea]|uniref:heme exporter protein CcmB n=1 Tax=unclassified Nonomuraea TaxID=2593643 RepID=UPI0033CC53EC